jgi:hypothetical protein
MAGFSEMMPLAYPLSGAGDASGTGRSHFVLIKPSTGSPMPARIYLDELLCSKMRQKVMFNPRETARKLT